MKKTVYSVTYEYYQYNSGAADNGYYKKTINFKNLEEALKINNLINKSIEKRKLSDKQYREDDYSFDIETIITEEMDDELKNKYIPYMGYFLEVQLKKSECNETLLNSKGEEVDNGGNLLSTYGSTEFSDCPYCYDIANGADNECKHCNGDGDRKLTSENMRIAQSAQEWLANQMQDFWSDYNSVYKLNRYIIKWFIESKDNLCIEAGYSCRGSETVDYYYMPLHWLYAQNRKELMQAQYDQEQQEKAVKENQRKLNELEALKKRTKELESQLNKGN